jgi:hypothetical protein
VGAGSVVVVAAAVVVVVGATVVVVVVVVAAGSESLFPQAAATRARAARVAIFRKMGGS